MTQAVLVGRRRRRLLGPLAISRRPAHGARHLRTIDFLVALNRDQRRRRLLRAHGSLSLVTDYRQHRRHRAALRRGCWSSILPFSWPPVRSPATWFSWSDIEVLDGHPSADSSPTPEHAWAEHTSWVPAGSPTRRRAVGRRGPFRWRSRPTPASAAPISGKYRRVRHRAGVQHRHPRTRRPRVTLPYTDESWKIIQRWARWYGWPPPTSGRRRTDVRVGG